MSVSLGAPRSAVDSYCLCIHFHAGLSSRRSTIYAQSCAPDQPSCLLLVQRQLHRPLFFVQDKALHEWAQPLLKTLQ